MLATTVEAFRHLQRKGFGTARDRPGTEFGGIANPCTPVRIRPGPPSAFEPRQALRTPERLRRRYLIYVLEAGWLTLAHEHHSLADLVRSCPFDYDDNAVPATT